MNVLFNTKENQIGNYEVIYRNNCGSPPGMEHH